VLLKYKVKVLNHLQMTNWKKTFFGMINVSKMLMCWCEVAVQLTYCSLRLYLYRSVISC